MNNSTRKALGTIIDKLTDVAPRLDAQLNELRMVGERLTDIRDEIQDRYDEMSERLQESEKGQDALSSIDRLTEAVDAIDMIIAATEFEVMADIVRNLDDARGEE